MTSSDLKPILKWAGGKEKELKYILPNTPKFNRYFEPFVGGGAVFTAIAADSYYINDLSQELMLLYDCISTVNVRFYNYVQRIDVSWSNAKLFFLSRTELIDLYLNYRSGLLSKDTLLKELRDFCVATSDEIKRIIPSGFGDLDTIMIKEVETNLFRKMCRMKELEKQKHILPDDELMDNIETAINSALYMTYRELYNKYQSKNDELSCSLFFFIRNFAYSGMFRYNDKGEFNVPYGGIAYNSKTLTKKTEYYKSDALMSLFRKTRLYNLDFETFLNTVQPKEDDFVFLDPPYDSEFSTYAQNAFTKEDHIRLANYMIKSCKA